VRRVKSAVEQVLADEATAGPAATNA
jgi:hypothetical protein